MGYQKGSLSQRHGIWIRVSGINHLADGRWKTTIYILDQREKVIEKKQVASLKKETFNIFLERISTDIEQFIMEHANLIIQQLMTRDANYLTLEVYAELRWLRISKIAKWARQEERYWDLWEEKLRAVFGSVDLKNCSKEVLEERMEGMTHRRRRKISVSEEERMAWVILSGILECAVRERILSENQVGEHARKCKQKLSTVASKNLAKRSMMEEEQRMLLEICLQRREQAGLYNAILLQYLCGMTVAELCGLSVKDWRNRGDISWLEITRMYRQKRGENAYMTALLESSHAYRKIPCSRIMVNLLSQQIRQLRKQGLGKKEDPIFVNEMGLRITPEEYKKTVAQIQDEIIRHGAKLSFVKRGSRLSGEDRPSVFYGDLLRSTAEYNLRTVCGFPDAEVEALLGRERLYTYATHYVDWTNTMVLSVQAERINCLWHSKFLPLNGETRGTLREGVLWEGHAEAGAEIRIQAKYGFSGVIQEVKTE